ncbi:peptidylprolyl isomerase [Micromonospora sp. NPDC049044]|uniref:peptidylprolyl isomerase n=1 Tax=Micromonospora sp. NPDC049044 TaxID=3154827 RepID=UPI0033E38DC5
MKRLLMSVALVMLAVSASGCGSTEKSVDPPPNALATVAGEPITVERVQALMPDDPLPPVLVVGGYSGPWGEALNLAIRDELLVREAARRGLDGSTRAEQIATLIKQEQRDNPGFTIENIADDEARTWYQEHRNLFGDVARAEVAWAEFTDGDEAKKAMDRVAGADQPTFQRLLREDKPAKSGTATIDDQHDDVDPMITRGAYAIAAAGGIGLSADPKNSRWWVVRVESISFETVTWDEALAYRVKSAMTAYRQDEHLRQLADSLRKKWPVHVYEARLADVMRTEEAK